MLLWSSCAAAALCLRAACTADSAWLQVRQQQLQQQYAQRMPQMQAMSTPRGPPQPPMAGMFPQGGFAGPQSFYGPPAGPSGMPRPPQGPGPMGMYPPMFPGRMPMPVSFPCPTMSSAAANAAGVWGGQRGDRSWANHPCASMHDNGLQELLDYPGPHNCSLACPRVYARQVGYHAAHLQDWSRHPAERRHVQDAAQAAGAPGQACTLAPWGRA